MNSSGFPLWRRAPRNTLWLVIALVLLAVIAFTSPAQLPVVLYKASLIALAGVLGYWLDRSFFPYARPDGYLVSDWRHGRRQRTSHAHTAQPHADFPVVPAYMQAFCYAMLRRAIIVGAAIVAMAVAL